MAKPEKSGDAKLQGLSKCMTASYTYDNKALLFLNGIVMLFYNQKWRTGYEKQNSKAIINGLYGCSFICEHANGELGGG